MAVLGLAKTEEKLIVPQKNGVLAVFKVPFDTPFLYLLQRIRNEAHRFALSYHRKRRSIELKLDV